MIAHLSGTVLEKQPPYLLLAVAGVGYECLASDHTFAACPPLGESFSVHTHLVIREDAHTLFAFSDRNERFLFRHLLKVSGVGPKLAITILSSTDLNTLTQSILDQNVAVLTQIPGIGKKTAERLVMEMRDRLAKSWPAASSTRSTSSPNTHATLLTLGCENEAVQGLEALGYKTQTARALVRQALQFVDAPADMDTQRLIRMALQKVVQA